MADNKNDNKTGSRKFVTELSGQGREFCIIGLTGKVRSGASDVCSLLANPKFPTFMDLPASSREPSQEDAREYRVIHRYLRERWKPFVELSVTAVILSYVLDLGCEIFENTRDDENPGRTATAESIREVLRYCVGEAPEEEIKKDNENAKNVAADKSRQFKEEVLKKVEETDGILRHGLGNNVCINRNETLKEACENLLEKITGLNSLFTLWADVKKELEGDPLPGSYPHGTSFFFCFGVLPVLEKFIKEKLKKDDRYPIALQDFGNSIRATGSVISVVKNKNDLKIDAIHLFALPRRINQFLKVLRKYDLGKKHAEGNAVFVVINNFKNIFEAYYFKRRYSAFYLMAVSCDEGTRREKFISHDKFIQMNLREDLSSGKKIYKSVSGYNLGKDRSPDAFDRQLRDKIKEDLDMRDAELEFVREIFCSGNNLRRSAYEQNLEPFIFQDVVTCIENADIFVTRNYEEDDYHFDHQLIRQLGRIVTLILHPGLLTPTKIERCMQIAMTAKLNSGCLSRQVGAVVTDRDYNILSIGWNDAPCGAESCLRRNFFDLARKDDRLAYSDYELHNKEFRNYVESVNDELTAEKPALKGLPMAFCFKDIYQDLIKQRDQIYTRSLHGEERALASCSNELAKNGYLFTTSSPCELCAKRAKEAGISKIYYIQLYPGISKDHVIEIGNQDKRAKYEFFVGAVGLAYIKLYTPLIPYKDELAAFGVSPTDVYKKIKKHRSSGQEGSTPESVSDPTSEPPVTGGNGHEANQAAQLEQVSQ